ncbi:MAG: radical SAM protein [Pseudomonadota bacterium]|nr:radical SAM protein [Pseudomonadota bacterium]
MDAEATAKAVELVRAWPASRRRAGNLGLLRAAPLFDIELASACNVVCTFCPRDDMERPKTVMDAATFDSVEAFLPPGAIAMLSGLGDSLLHPQLDALVARLHGRGVSTCIITNGVRLVPARQDTLIAAGIAEIQVSVHGLDDATVRSVVPVGANPARVRANLEHLAGRPGPRVRINFVETPENAHAREDVRRWAEGLGFRFFYRRLHTRGGSLGEPRDDAGCSGCGIFGSVTFITVEGDVMPCVNDVRGEGRLGNVRAVTWTDVLAWKKAVIKEDRWFAPCAGCDDDYRWVLLAQGGLDGP